jgi:hypothetical protein
MKYVAIIGAVVLGLVILVAGWFFYGIGIQNEEVQARNRVEAQQKNVETHHDAMWKILAQKAGISNQYKPANYKELLAEVVEGRKGGNLAKTITEQNPNFDLSLLKDLSQSVEGEHKVVVREEKKLLDYNRVHSNIIKDRWKRRFLDAEQTTPIEVSVITSTRSKKAIETGVDDDVNLFPR